MSISNQIEGYNFANTRHRFKDFIIFLNLRIGLDNGLNFFFYACDLCVK